MAVDEGPRRTFVHARGARRPRRDTAKAIIATLEARFMIENPSQSKVFR